VTVSPFRVYHAAHLAEDGTIVSRPIHPDGLARVSAQGGEPTVLTKLERGDIYHVWPEFLPGGMAVLFNDRAFRIRPALSAFSTARHCRTIVKRTAMPPGRNSARRDRSPTFRAS